MSIYRYILSDDVFLLSNDEGSQIKIRCKGDEARMLFADMDEELLRRAEGEALSHKARRVVLEFAGKYWEIAGFMERAGYKLSTGKKILSVGLAELLDSKGVQKSIKIEFPGTEYVPFNTLMLFEAEQLAELFEASKVPLTRDDIIRFDDDLSGVVFNENRDIEAVILSSTCADEIIIECLYGTHKQDPKYLMAALQGFARQIIDLELTDIYKKITALEINATVGPLFRRLLDRKYEMNEDGAVMRAEKSLDRTADNEPFEYAEADIFKIGELLNSAEEKLRYLYCQNNINWKTDWSI